MFTYICMYSFFKSNWKLMGLCSYFQLGFRTYLYSLTGLGQLTPVTGGDTSQVELRRVPAGVVSCTFSALDRWQAGFAAQPMTLPIWQRLVPGSIKWGEHLSNSNLGTSDS